MLIIGALIVYLPGHRKPDVRTSPARASAALALSRQLTGAMVGNDRPAVGPYDGPMVRRCEAVAGYATSADRAPGLARALRAAARSAGLAVTEVPADVLSPATLERPAPDVVFCLPEASGVAAARRLIAIRLPGAERLLAESVLVHELKFTAHPARGTAAQLLAAVGREGILSDTLIEYKAATDPAGRLVVSYTGPLLSAAEIGVVEAAIARPAGLSPAAVAVAPLSASGPGVRLATEPPPAPATGAVLAPPHEH